MSTRAWNASVLGDRRSLRGPRFTDAEVCRMRAALADGLTWREMSARFGASRGTFLRLFSQQIPGPALPSENAASPATDGGRAP